MPFIQVKLKISPKQQAQALKGAKIRLTADCIGRGEIVLLHPLNAKKLANSKSGVNLELSPGELMQTAAYHELIPSQPEGLSGSGLFDSIWNGLKKVGSWLKDSGVGSTLADVAQEVASPFVGNEVAKTGRNIFKGLTGVGLAPIKKGISKGKKTIGSGLYL